MMDEMLIEFMKYEPVRDSRNIAIGHTKFKINWKVTIITVFFGHIVSKGIKYYFFYFCHQGIYLYQYEGYKFIGEPFFIEWSKISEFTVKEKKLEVEISFVFKQEKYSMMLKKKEAKYQWVKENMEYLMLRNFFAVDLCSFDNN